MIQKVFVSPEGMATFVCPQCEKLVRTDVSKYSRLNHAVRIRAKCACGHGYSVDLERRRHLRTEVNLPGVVFRLMGSRKTGQMPMVVRDLSLRGVRFRVSKANTFLPADMLYVEFVLDDVARSMIRKEVVVRTASGRDIGVEFTGMNSSDPSDKALGFYFITFDE